MSRMPIACPADAPRKSRVFYAGRRLLCSYRATPGRTTWWPWLLETLAPDDIAAVRALYGWQEQTPIPIGTDESPAAMALIRKAGGRLEKEFPSPELCESDA